MKNNLLKFLTVSLFAVFIVCCSMSASGETQLPTSFTDGLSGLSYIASLNKDVEGVAFGGNFTWSIDFEIDDCRDYINQPYLTKTGHILIEKDIFSSDFSPIKRLEFDHEYPGFYYDSTTSQYFLTSYRDGITKVFDLNTMKMSEGNITSEFTKSAKENKEVEDSLWKWDNREVVPKFYFALSGKAYFSIQDKLISYSLAEKKSQLLGTAFFAQAALMHPRLFPHIQSVSLDRRSMHNTTVRITKEGLTWHFNSDYYRGIPKISPTGAFSIRLMRQQKDPHFVGKYRDGDNTAEFVITAPKAREILQFDEKQLPDDYMFTGFFCGESEFYILEKVGDSLYGSTVDLSFLLEGKYWDCTTTYVKAKYPNSYLISNPLDGKVLMETEPFIPSDNPFGFSTPFRVLDFIKGRYITKIGFSPRKTELFCSAKGIYAIGTERFVRIFDTLGKQLHTFEAKENEEFLSLVRSANSASIILISRIKDSEYFRILGSEGRGKLSPLPYKFQERTRSDRVLGLSTTAANRSYIFNNGWKVFSPNDSQKYRLDDGKTYFDSFDGILYYQNKEKVFEYSNDMKLIREWKMPENAVRLTDVLSKDCFLGEGSAESTLLRAFNKSGYLCRNADWLEFVLDQDWLYMNTPAVHRGYRYNLKTGEFLFRQHPMLSDFSEDYYLGRLQNDFIGVCKWVEPEPSYVDEVVETIKQYTFKNQGN